jgi:hypothetical protein
MRHIAVSGLALLTMFLGGCASLVAPADPAAPLELAFTAPVSELEARSDRGDNAARYALSFLSMNGLRGVAQDVERITDLRQRAAASTSYTITQYIPAVGGGTGRINLIPITQPGMSAQVMLTLDLCGLRLMRDAAATVEMFCPEGAAERLGPFARQVAAASASRTPLP